MIYRACLATVYHISVKSRRYHYILLPPSTIQLYNNAVIVNTLMLICEKINPYKTLIL